ncbi:hypothetical protein DSECCO2_550230 [anaerobic digester metagenome]
MGVVEHTDHDAVGDNDARAAPVRFKQAHRMTRHHDKRLFICQNLKILFDKLILHPVLADLAGFAIGDKLIRIKRHFVIQVVINHDLKGFALNAVAFVCIDGLSVDALLGHKAVAVDTPAGHQLLQKFRCQPLMKLLRDIAQGIFQGQLDFPLVQRQLPLRCTANPILQLGVFRQNSVKFYRHCVPNFTIIHSRILPF